jgi:hypothetical protein
MQPGAPAIIRLIKASDFGKSISDELAPNVGCGCGAIGDQSPTDDILSVTDQSHQPIPVARQPIPGDDSQYPVG